MEYTSYKYIYPPRPETKLPPASLNGFEGKYLAQPKLNGSCMVLATDGNEIHVMNRHKKSFSNFKLDMDELKSLHRGNGWMVLCGEYMNKSKSDENGKVWNQKFVIFDILVYENRHLIGEDFFWRSVLLQTLYGTHPISKPYMFQITDNVFHVMSMFEDFLDVYNEITKYDMYEGLVLKLKNGKLENGIREKNNVRTQIKVRKETKNYSF